MEFAVRLLLAGIVLGYAAVTVIGLDLWRK